MSVDTAVDDRADAIAVREDGELPPDPAIDPATAAECEPIASPRARAREEQSTPAITQRNVWRRVWAYFRPPEIWDQPRPALRELVSYAVQAPWTGPGPIAWAGRIYAGLALAAHAGVYLGLWVIQRPARALSALVVCALVALTPPGAWARSATAHVLVWLAERLT